MTDVIDSRHGSQIGEIYSRLSTAMVMSFEFAQEAARDAQEARYITYLLGSHITYDVLQIAYQMNQVLDVFQLVTRRHVNGTEQ